MTHRCRSSQQRAHTFSRIGWADAQPGANFTEPASLAFSTRTEVRPAQRKPRTSNLGWWVLCVIGLAGFLLLVHAMLARNADTAGTTPNDSVAPAIHSGAPTPPEEIDEPTISTPAMAPLVYKCVGAGHTVSYQSAPCDGQQSMARIYDAAPDTAADDAWSRRQQRKAAADAAELSRSAGTYRQDGVGYATSDALDERRAKCQSAKDYRESILRQVGLARTFDLLRQLDEQVYEACKGL